MSETSTRLTIAAKDMASRTFGTVGRSIDGMYSSLGRVTGGLLRFGTSLTGIAGIGGTVGLGALIKGSIDSADHIGKLSIRLGASTEALSEYSHVAELAGVRFETLTMGWQRMTRRVAEAAKGTGEARGALQELGLDAKALAQLKPEAQFEAITRAMGGVKNEADRVRLAMKLFDSEGVSLIQIMDQGVEAIQKARDEAKAFGKSMDSDMVKKATAANDAITNLRASISGFSIELATVAAPKITEWADSMTNAIRMVKQEGWMDLFKAMAGDPTAKDRENMRGVTPDQIAAMASKKEQQDLAAARLKDIEIKAPPPNFWDGFIHGTEEAAKKFKETMSGSFDWGVKTAEATSKSMANAFDDLFVDAMEGRLKKFSDYLTEFFKGIGRAMSQLVAQQIATQIMTSAVSGFGGFGSPGTTGGAPTVGMGKGMGGGGNMKTSVNIVNNSGTPVRGKASAHQVDPRNAVIDIVIDAYARNKNNMRTIMGGMA